MDKPPLTFQKTLSLLRSLGEPPEAVPAPSALPAECRTPPKMLDAHEYDVPSLEDLGVDESQLEPCVFLGGETEGLARLNRCLERKVSTEYLNKVEIAHFVLWYIFSHSCLFTYQDWICSFEKPKTSPNSLAPSTTVLSPYIRFGCVSSRLVYHKVNEVTL